MLLQAPSIAGHLSKSYVIGHMNDVEAQHQNSDWVTISFSKDNVPQFFGFGHMNLWNDLQGK